MHHKWTYVFINLGLGANVTNFNYTLTQPFWNETGNGTLCVPKLALPVGLTVSDGAEGSIQVVTVGANGNALYNCADITFRSNATTLSTNDCVTDEGVTFAPIAVEAGANGSTTANTTTTTGKSAAATGGVNMIALSSVVGLTLAFVCGMGL
ncbi:hypothetical protein B0T17DRAFT_531342 [Bombardia bombarda]|uniref:Copper acquisition factor BIM1-like domain-containing protein n=1 Tax=Bombardia bombarda TaxID=252184 RepID=A0AA40C4X0_9PEZI|nr:hypothetical protein B0T17DRAFT_531342 [Bombardia bombarda]